MVIKSNKKNLIVKDLYTKKYKPKIVKKFNNNKFIISTKQGYNIK